MTKHTMEDDLRDKIIDNPRVLLDDHAIMRALVEANEGQQGTNIVDLRAIAMNRLEARFDRLEDTHRNVIAAAYDNLAGTNQVHRAILRMMDAADFATFLADLTGDVANTLRVDAIRLVLETETPESENTMGPVVALAPIGFVDDYITLGRNMPARQVTLRGYKNHGASLYGDRAGYIQSEACLKLDFGPDHMPGLLVMGSEDPQQFTPQQGTDLLTFFTGVFERVMRRWLA
ncbi:DUF484 family protein [Yoonia sediminilitoris]|uniref:DUF484 family protein n=1 Tax=Yoonia sediminilitoris TaxID=1286148 RepID=A0A2T6K5C7_9RHOB|nr:DUF484 family protein [Yoonia sediminilitoris]PUB09870.1 hypothetical protein C8N45_1243 [Yoonia sediminilitoris]RCW89593.1 hypothetical protein DFP92_1243 [Yoonia sediminilitoris]